ARGQSRIGRPARRPLRRRGRAGALSRPPGAAAPGPPHPRPGSAAMEETVNSPATGPTPTGAAPYRAIDRLREAMAAGFGTGVSPLALGMALMDWSAHLA